MVSLLKFTRIPLALTAVIVSGAVAAQGPSVQLQSNNGVQKFSGMLVSATGDRFTLRTKSGVLSLKKDDYTCLGVNCPVGRARDVDMVIAGPSVLTGTLFPILAEGYATQIEGEAIVLNEEGAFIEDSELSDDHSFSSFNIRFKQSEDTQQTNFLVTNSAGNSVYDQLANAQVSLAVSEEPMTDAIVQKARKNGVGDLASFPQHRILAIDGSTVVVHPKNQIDVIKVSDISGILSGAISNWSQLGGADHQINIYAASADEVAHSVIRTLVNVSNTQQNRARSTMVNSVREMTKAIEMDPYGFGLVRFSSIRNVKPVAIETACGIVIEPDAFSIQAEEYTLQSRVTVYNAKDLSDFSQGFIDYLDTPSVEELVTKAGFVSLGITKEPKEKRLKRLQTAVENTDPAASGNTVSQFVADTLSTTRLSTTFRFIPRSYTLDAKARRDVARLAAYINDQKPSKVILAGFSDAGGSFDVNLSVSTKRAQALRSALFAYAGDGGFKGTTIQAKGFGELVPVACEETQEGRISNRRVEVWVD